MTARFAQTCTFSTADGTTWTGATPVGLTVARLAALNVTCAPNYRRGEADCYSAQQPDAVDEAQQVQRPSTSTLHASRGPPS
jgi:hypothetical protein